MIVSSIAFKVALSALVILLVLVILDDATGPHYTSPAAIAIPGALAGLVMIVAFIVGVLAMIWGA